ncbi:hypothetical protein [Breoghania sp.]|uniref:hypothetical protein n=1 Tax=Breoghania sp. TaxID=2065378 RepID=UPI002AABB4A1|nr:hypothetical protein [Breoghania sp.]
MSDAEDQDEGEKVGEGPSLRGAGMMSDKIEKETGNQDEGKQDHKIGCYVQDYRIFAEQPPASLAGKR